MPVSGSTAWPNADDFEAPTPPTPLGDTGDTDREHDQFHADIGAAWEAMRTDSRWTNARTASVHALRGPEHTDLLKPTAALAETLSRATQMANQGSVLTSGTLRLQAIVLAAGMTISTVSFLSGTTALSGGTHQWFGLYDKNRAKLRVTADDTSTAWAASTIKTLALSSSYLVPTTDLYYLAILITASTTVPSLVGAAGMAVNGALAPVLTGSTSDTGLTDPASAPATAGAITAQGILPYAYVS